MSSSGSQYEELMQLAEAYWSARGSRMTAVRRIICLRIFEQKESIDAEKLLSKARKSDKLISLATVYRVLGALTEAGLLVEVEGADGKKNYNVADPNTNASSHIVCEDCGHVAPIDNPCMGLREAEAAKSAGFSPKRISLRYEASCDKLKETGNCEKIEPESNPPSNGQ
ncbi:MAG: Fur family transcriptional regulator [Verrucomicrobiota bacterium]